MAALKLLEIDSAGDGQPAAVRRVRDFAQVSEAPLVTHEVAASAELIIASRPPK